MKMTLMIMMSMLTMITMIIMMMMTIIAGSKPNEWSVWGRQVSHQAGSSSDWWRLDAQQNFTTYYKVQMILWSVLVLPISIITIIRRERICVQPLLQFMWSQIRWLRAFLQRPHWVGSCDNLWLSFLYSWHFGTLIDDAGAFLGSAKGLKPEGRGDILLHDTDLLLVHNKVERWFIDIKLVNMVALLNPMLCNCQPLCSLSSSWTSPALTSHHDHNEDHDDDRHDDHHDDNDDPGKTGSWERRVQAGWWWGGPPYYCNHTGPNIIEVAVVVVVVLPVQLVVLAIELWGLQQHYCNSTFISSSMLTSCWYWHFWYWQQQNQTSKLLQSRNSDHFLQDGDSVFALDGLLGGATKVNFYEISFSGNSRQ